MLRRRREGKTDYEQRLGLIKGNKRRLVVRRSLNYIHAQIVEYSEKGDVTVIEKSSKHLQNYGWKLHCGNLPAAYLTGLIIGMDAKKKGIDEVIVDIGLETSTKGASIYALIKGAIDAGLKIPVDQKMFPSEDRINGKHIARYAQELKSNKEKYSRQFLVYIKNGIEPEKIVEHFNEVKKKILNEIK